MPIYEYRCEDCRRRVSLFYQSIALAAAGADAARCPQCGGARLTRLVSRFNVGRPAERPAYDPDAAGFDADSAEYSENTGFPGMEEQGGLGALGGVEDTIMPGLDEDDPRSIARWARQMQSQSGEDLGPEFNSALSRIESGEDPDRVLEDMEPALAGGEDGGDFGGDDA
jgi:putative FmdB family regulatory protein